MNRKKLIFILPIIILFSALILFGARSPLSTPQKDTISSIGYPDHFVIAYMPSINIEGEESLTRTEIWYYRNLGMKITFYAGEIFEVQDISNELTLEENSTRLKPQNFRFDMSKSKIDSKLNGRVYKLDYLPELFEKGEYETYANSEATYVLEHGKLTYFQTLEFIYEE